jgi:hypothetical protein
VSYRLLETATEPLDRRQARVSVAVPAGKAPAMVVWGSSLTGLTRLGGSADLLVDGETFAEAHGELGGYGPATLRDAKAHTLTVTARTDETLRAGQSATVALIAYVAQ